MEKLMAWLPKNIPLEQDRMLEVHLALMLHRNRIGPRRF